MQVFFKRLLYIIEFQGFKSTNDFALNGLKYNSASKLNRLRDEKNKPSVEIILDIATNFPNINTHWLLTGKGNMLLIKEDYVNQNIQEPHEIYKSEANQQLAENYVTLKENSLLKDAIIKSLREKVVLQEKQLVPFESTFEKLERRIAIIEQFNELVKYRLDSKK